MMFVVAQDFEPASRAKTVIRVLYNRMFIYVLTVFEYLRTIVFIASNRYANSSANLVVVLYHVCMLGI